MEHWNIKRLLSFIKQGHLVEHSPDNSKFLLQKKCYLLVQAFLSSLQNKNIHVSAMLLTFLWDTFVHIQFYLLVLLLFQVTGYLLLIAGKFHEELYQQAFGVIQSQSPKTEVIQQTSGFMLTSCSSFTKCLGLFTAHDRCHLFNNWQTIWSFISLINISSNPTVNTAKMKWVSPITFSHFYSKPGVKIQSLCDWQVRNKDTD